MLCKAVMFYQWCCISEQKGWSKADMNDWKAVAAKLSVGRSTVFALWNSNQLASVRIGKRRLSTDKQIAEYIARLEQGGAA